MERLKAMKETLMSCIQGQMSNLGATDTKELGEAIDMVKDLSEAIYYCSIAKAMEDKEKEEKYKHEYHYYHEPYLDYYRDMDRDYGRMYYTGSNGEGGSTTYRQGVRGTGRGMSNRGGRRGFTEMFDNDFFPGEMRDYREGNSPIQRKYYMESKEMKQDKHTQMKELEKYMQELSKDITEMIRDAEPDEIALLKSKLNTLADKIK